MTNNLAYCLAVEKLLELEIPERAQFLRVLLNELTRIQSHLVWLGTHAMDIGALTVFLYCFREREDLLRIFEAVSGQRMMTSYFRIGGLALEPPLASPITCKTFLDIMPGTIDQYEGLLTSNPIWMGRLKGVGYLSPRRRDCAGRDRAAAARQRRGLGPAPRHALLRLREVQVQRAHLATTAMSGRATSSACRRCASRVKICQQAMAC